MKLFAQSQVPQSLGYFHLGYLAASGGHRARTHEKREQTVAAPPPRTGRAEPGFPASAGIVMAVCMFVAAGVLLVKAVPWKMKRAAGAWRVKVLLVLLSLACGAAGYGFLSWSDRQRAHDQSAQARAAAQVPDDPPQRVPADRPMAAMGR